MSNIFIVGGAGKVARRLAQQLSARGHQAFSLYRHPEQASELKALGATAVLGNLLELDAKGLAERMVGCDVVVFCAGAGGKGGMEMTHAIDGRGLEHAVAAAQLAGIARFVLVSAFPESFRAKQMPQSFENYMAVKKMADVHLAESGLDWVILRPGTLQDAPGTRKVRTGLAIPYGEVSRDDVAATLVEIIDRPAVSRIIIELTQGETPVAESIQRLERA